MSFLDAIKESFLVSMETGPRSNEKLKVLHGFVAKDLQQRLGEDYKVKSLGFEDGKEEKISGRYMDKNVDIVVQKDEKNIAGIAVKFVMSNYSQNSNNYFENMLGETANIRTKNVPYFQMFIIPETLPYYKSGGKLDKWEKVTPNNLDKYIKLSDDDSSKFYHTPDKLFFAIVDYGQFKTKTPTNKKEYIDYYLNNEFNVSYSKQKVGFKNQAIYNDYEKFMEKVYHSIKAI